MRDTCRNFLDKNVIASIAGAGDDVAIVGTVIDKAGFDSLTYVINTGVLVDANATFDALLEESDAAGSGFTEVADTDMISQGSGAPEANAGFTFAADGNIRKIGYIGKKRYTRLTLTPTGNTGAWPIGVTARLGHAYSSNPTQGAS